MHQLELRLVARINTADDAHRLAEALGELVGGGYEVRQVDYKVEGAAYRWPDAMPEGEEVEQHSAAAVLDFTDAAERLVDEHGLEASAFEDLEPAYQGGYGVDQVKDVLEARTREED